MIGPWYWRRSWTAESSTDRSPFCTTRQSAYAFVITISAPNFEAISAGGIRTLFGLITGMRAGVRTGPWGVTNRPRRPSPSRSRTSNTAGHPDLLIIGFAWPASRVRPSRRNRYSELCPRSRGNAPQHVRPRALGRVSDGSPAVARGCADLGRIHRRGSQTPSRTGTAEGDPPGDRAVPIPTGCGRLPVLRAAAETSGRVAGDRRVGRPRDVPRHRDHGPPEEPPP